MNLTDLLMKVNIDPEQVIVLRHRPPEPRLRKMLPWLAEEKPDVFNAYQQTQSKRVETAMKREKAKYIASFIGDEAGRAVFVGIYEKIKCVPMSPEDLLRIPQIKELVSLGMPVETLDPSFTIWFELVLQEFYSRWKGKLIIKWPGREVVWCRWAGHPQNQMPILSILEESKFDANMPTWDAIDFSWEEIAVIPTRWKEKLKEWRGVYYIFDTSDSKGYVGSAYGNENIFGRWINYSTSGHGGNKNLIARNPKNFQFSILQRVSPDMEETDIIDIENSWKVRLHTRSPNGLNEN